MSAADCEVGPRQSTLQLPHFYAILADKMSKADVLINEDIHRPCTRQSYLAVFRELHMYLFDNLPALFNV